MHSDELSPSKVEYQQIMSKCPTREGALRGRYDHFLFHGKGEPALLKSKLAFIHIPRTTGLFTPMIEEEPYGEISGLTFYSPCLRMLRGVIQKRWNLRAGIYSRGFLIAPREWPGVMEKAFGLQEPPTPAETATALLMAPSLHFWGYTSRVDFRFKCAESALLWWLMGLPEECMMKHLHLTRAALHLHLSYAISQMMRRDRFSW